MFLTSSLHSALVIPTSQHDVIGLVFPRTSFRALEPSELVFLWCTSAGIVLTCTAFTAGNSDSVYVGGSVGVPMLLLPASLHSDSVHQSSKNYVVVFTLARSGSVLSSFSRFYFIAVYFGIFVDLQVLLVIFRLSGTFSRDRWLPDLGRYF